MARVSFYNFVMPNLLRAERGRLALEVYALIDVHGHTEAFEGRVRLRHSGRFLVRQTFGTSSEARRWIASEADRLDAAEAQRRANAAASLAATMRNRLEARV